MSKTEAASQTRPYPGMETPIRQQVTVPEPIEAVDGAGSERFSNSALFLALVGIPLISAFSLGGGIWLALGLIAVLGLPILAIFWTVASRLPDRKSTVRSQGAPVERYLDFQNGPYRRKYCGSRKVPMASFTELYFDGVVDFKGDCLTALEHRRDWATFEFTTGLYRYFFFTMLPDVVFHTKARDEKQTHEVYDRGDDFYGWFLGDSMIFSAGLISDPYREETLDELQTNKMNVVCQKVGLQNGETLLDVGCGWGSFSAFASSKYSAHVTGVTLSRNQATAASKMLNASGISEDQSSILCLDYRDIPSSSRFRRIVCLEMAEHVGIRNLKTFPTQIYALLDDQGVFFLQIGGLRKCWQFEDLLWGLFMNKHIFPGADASVPLGVYITMLENVGFEVKSVDTIGIHYAATIWRWYKTWKANEAKVLAKYGRRWFRIWLYFLGSATIEARQGGATAYQITLVKNLNATNRVLGVMSQLGVRALAT